MDSKTEMQPNKFVTQGKTKVVKGSILSPELGNLRLVFVPCGQSGKPDTTLHTVLNKKWRSVEAELKGWHAQNITFKMGNVQSTAVQSDTWILHSLCYNKEGELDATALANCVKKVAEMAKYEKASVHVSNLTIKEIPTLVDLLSTQCLDKGIAVYFYEES